MRNPTEVGRRRWTRWARATIALTDYALAAGVVLDGTVRSDAAGRRRGAELRLAGGHRGRLALHGRRLSGTLDGRALDVRVPREPALPGVRRYG